MHFSLTLNPFLLYNFFTFCFDSYASAGFWPAGRRGAACSPYSDDECEQIITQLEALLDGDLEPEAQTRVIKMVNECEYCLEQLRIEKGLRQMIKNGLSSLAMNGSLLARIRTSIRAARGR